MVARRTGRSSVWITSALLGVALAALVGRALAPAAGEPAEGSQEAIELSVYAAASTREALQAIEAAYVKENRVKLVFTFGASGDLAKQILADGKADVFLSAGEKEMDRVAAEQLLLDDTRQPLVSNQLAVIERIDPADPEKSLFAKPFNVEQLERPEIERLSLGNPEAVPAGRYAKEWLEKKGRWKAVEHKVLQAPDVRAALAAVETDSAQAGIVYRTDVAQSRKARSVHDVPLEEGPRISYPVAVLKDRPNGAEARRFVEHLAGPAAREIFARHGFIAPVPRWPPRQE